MTTNRDRVKDLQRLYKTNKALAKVCDNFAGRERNSNFSTVDRLCQAADLDRADVIDVLRKFETLKFGKFIVGRKGKSSRFQWSVSLVAVGQLARDDSTVDEESLEDGPDGKVEEEEDDGNSKSITHVYRLRGDFSVELALPAHLKSADAQRLADFIKTLPFGE